MEQGLLTFAHILTLRTGELTFDPVLNRLMPLEREAIKIMGTGEQAHPWHCIFHSAAGCDLHPLRPAQCAALFCTDTQALAHMYHQDRACRADMPLLQPGWLELVEAHEEACPLHPLADAAYEIFQSTSPIREDLSESILQCVRYDLAFRQLCTEKAHMAAQLLPCFLGRPVHAFLPSVGLEATQTQQGELVLKKLAKAAYFS